MGWLFMRGMTRKALIASRVNVAGSTVKTLKYCCKGNVLWLVRESPDGQRWIECDLMGSERNYGWGYKDMEESMGPCYYSCPMSYLDMVPVADPNWRERVKQYNTPITVGQVVKLRHCKIPEVTITKIRPLRGTYNGILYRLRREQIDWTTY